MHTSNFFLNLTKINKEQFKRIRRLSSFLLVYIEYFDVIEYSKYAVFVCNQLIVLFVSYGSSLMQFYVNVKKVGNVVSVVFD